MTTFSDDFNRADAGTLGANWVTAHNGSLAIVSNTARLASGDYDGNLIATPLSSADHEVSVNVSGFGAVTYFDVKVRNTGTGASRDGYQCTIGGTNEYSISRIDDGISTDLKTGTTTAFSGTKKLTGRIVGTTITLLIDDVLIDSTTSATYSSGGLVGIGCFNIGSTPIFDTFTAGDIGGGGGGGGGNSIAWVRG